MGRSRKGSGRGEPGPGVHASRRVCSWGNLKILAKAGLKKKKEEIQANKKQKPLNSVSSIGVLYNPEQGIGPQSRYHWEKLQRRRVWWCSS